MKDNITALPVRPTTDDDYMHAAGMMSIGGHFANYIAHAYFVADSHNKERLRAAFPDLFTKFYGAYLSERNKLNDKP